MTENITVCPHCAKSNRVPSSAGGLPRCGHCHQLLPWIVAASDGDFAEVAEGATLPVLVDFWAVWCGPCRTVSPVLDQLARERAGRVKLVKVDVDNSPHLAWRFGIQAVPTLMILIGGKVLARRAGAAPAAALRSWINGVLSQNHIVSKSG
jgi:thioredoxin 2